MFMIWSAFWEKLFTRLLHYSLSHIMLGMSFLRTVAIFAFHHSTCTLHGNQVQAEGL